MPIWTLLGECVFKSETPAPLAAGAGARAGRAAAGSVIGGLAGSAPRLGGRGARGAEWRARSGVGSSLRRRARAPSLVASPRRARPASLRNRLCPRMGWGSWEERAGARAGRDPPLPDSAPAVRAQRASRRSADVPEPRAGRYRCVRTRAGEGGLIQEFSGHSRAGVAPTTHFPSPRSHASLGSAEKRGPGPPPKPARDRCLGEKRNLTY